MEFSDCYGNGHHQSGGEGFGGHAGHPCEARGLGGEVGDVDESAQSFLPAVGQEIHETVEEMIAHEGAGGIGYFCRNSQGGEGLVDFPDGKGGEIGGRSTGHDGFVYGLISAIVG